MTPLPAAHRSMDCCAICLERAADCVCTWADALRDEPPAAEPLMPLPDPEPPTPAPDEGAGVDEPQIASLAQWLERKDIVA